MMLINSLFALVSLAVLGSVAPVPGASALSVESHNFVRNGAGHAHVARHLLDKRQTSTSRPRRCKARPTGSSLSSSGSSSSPASTSKAQAAPTTNAAKPSSSAPAPAPSSSKPVSSPPKTSTTKAVTPAPTQGNSGGYNSRKACVTYVGNVDVPRFAAGSGSIGCVINWSSWKPTWMSQLPGAVFVPMLHGPGQVSDFQKNVKAGFSTFALGFNEPNQSGQSVMSPGEAIGLWKQYIQPLKSQGYVLVSPACTNAPSGLTWQRQFVDGCSGCSIDAIATHFYGTDPQALISHLVEYHNAFGRDMWLTEYACQDFSGRNQQCSVDKTASFMKTTQDFMESQSWVKHYAYFGVLMAQNLGGVDPVNRLIYDNSYATPLGKQYLGI